MSKRSAEVVDEKDGKKQVADEKDGKKQTLRIDISQHGSTCSAFCITHYVITICHLMML